MPTLQVVEQFGRWRFLRGTHEVASRFPNEKRVVFASDATGEEIDEVAQSGHVDDVTELVFGVSKVDAELVEQTFDLSRLRHVRVARLAYPPVPTSLFTAPGIVELELASMTPRFERVGRPYPSLRKLFVRAFKAKKLLVALPEDLDAFSGLEDIEMYGVGLKALPAALGRVPLRRLVIQDAKSLKKLPFAFGPTLQELKLGKTGLRERPDTSAAPKAKVIFSAL